MASLRLLQFIVVVVVIGWRFRICESNGVANSNIEILCNIHELKAIYNISSFHKENAALLIAKHISMAFDGTEAINFCDKRKHIYLVTYFTEDILGHSELSFAINSLYVEYQRIIHNNTASIDILRYVPYVNRQNKIIEENWELFDARWNKVIILSNLISSLLDGQGNANQGQYDNTYLVWVDSDLMIANHTFSFSDLISSHESMSKTRADILVSGEDNPDNGIANTGCIVVRVSKWSQWFLHQWWTKWDRQTGMDQHVFDALYRQLPELERIKHIRILDVAEINSKYPGLINHRMEDPILHLAGESNFLRRQIFNESLKHLCKYHSKHHFGQVSLILNDEHNIHEGDSTHYPPYGLSRQVLHQIDYTSLYHSQWQQFQANLEREKSLINSDTIQFFEKSSIIQKWQGQIRELQQSLSKLVCFDPKSTATQYLLDSSKARVDTADDLHCINLKDVFYKHSAAAWYTVYHQYEILLQELMHNSVSVTTTSVLSLSPPHHSHMALAQLTLDAGFELLTVLHYDEESIVPYQQVLDELHVSISALQERHFHSPTNIDNNKVILYYKYKLAEYQALFSQDQYHKHHSSDPFQRNLVVQAWGKALSVWREMVERFQYFGTGNGVAHAYDEGIVVAMRIVYLLCSANEEGLGITDKKEIVSQAHGHLDWIHDIIFNMSKENNDIAQKFSPEWQYLSSLCQTYENQYLRASASLNEDTSPKETNGNMQQKKRFRKKKRKS